MAKRFSSGSAAMSSTESGGDLLQIPGLRGLGGGHRLFHPLARRIAEQAACRRMDERDRRVEHHVDEGEGDAGVERPQPPARQRRVQLPDAVPFVAGRRPAPSTASTARRCCRISHRSFPSVVVLERDRRPACRSPPRAWPEHPEDDARQRQRQDEQRPAVGEVAKLFVDPSLVTSADSLPSAARSW